MSNSFLDKFSNNNYTSTSLDPKEVDTPKIPKEAEETVLNEGVNIPNEEPEIVKKEKKSILPLSNNPKHVAPVAMSRHVEHVVEIDYEYQKKRKQKKIIAIVAGALAVIILIVSIVMMRLVTVSDFVGKNISEAKSWSKSNDIELVIEYEFSTKYDENVIVSQDIKANSRVFKGKTFNLKASKGADPEGKVELPDLITMNLDEINEWIDKNKLTNVKITKSFSEEIETNKVIEFTIEDGVSAETYKRKNQLQIIVSKGKEVFEKIISVPDFNNKTKEETEQWGKTNEVAIVIEEASSDTIAAGMVISQSVLSGEKVSKEDSVTVVVSTGKAILVPNFYGIYKEDAVTNYMDLNIITKEQYHNTINYGGLISQSVSAGAYVKESENTVILNYSLGKPYIDDLTQMTEKELPEYFYNFKVAGANITYTIAYINGDSELKGTIAATSKRSEYVSMNENIHIQIYK